MKIIYHSRDEMKTKWLNVSTSDTLSIFTTVANSLRALNSEAGLAVRDCFMPVSLTAKMQAFITEKLQQLNDRAGKREIDRLAKMQQEQLEVDYCINLKRDF